MKWLKSANQTVFGYDTPASMAVFRIILGGLCLINFLMIAIDYSVWFTETGLYPAQWAIRWAGTETLRINPLAATVDMRVGIGIYAGTCILSLMVMLGLYTRVAAVLLWVGVVSLHHRSPDILHSGDTLLRNYVLLLMFMPSGNKWSLDAVLAARKGKVLNQSVSVWPQRLVQWQLAVVYFTTVWHKFSGPAWREGYATYYPPRLEEFDRFWVPGFVNDLPVVYVSTYATLVTELALATLVFARPLRKYVLIGGLLMHGYIEYSMNIPLFQWVIVSAYVLHYEGHEVEAWVGRMRERWSAWRSKGAITAPVAEPTHEQT